MIPGTSTHSLDSRTFYLSLARAILGGHHAPVPITMRSKYAVSRELLDAT